MTEPVPTLQAAPRSLSPSLTVRVLFSGTLGQFGWLFFAFGMLFVVLFDPGAIVRERLEFRGGTLTAQGVVTGYDETNLTINDRRVYRTGFRFSPPGGEEVHGVSYATGTYETAGTAVTIEYVEQAPTSARIVGMRRSQSGGTAFIALIFPGVGLLLGIGSTMFRLRPLRLMKEGTLTTGTLRSSEPTNTRINGRTVMKLTFAFEPEGGGAYEAVAKSHQPHSLEDEPRELLLYDPRNPASATLLDALPCQPRVDDRGEFYASAARLPAALYLLLPGASMLAILRYLSG